MKKSGVFILTVLVFVLASLSSKAQDEDPGLVQLSGVVVTGDSLQPVPFTSILIDGTRRGTISDYFGFFSIVARKGDVIVFSSMGFKKSRVLIPDSLEGTRYSLIQMLIQDTLTLPEAVIYPWPTYEQFKQAFVTLKIPDDDLERAKHNLAMESMKDIYENMPMDGSMNYRNYIQEQTYKLYYAGQFPPNQLLNPFAWAKFIQAWKKGEFRRKD
ncbi:MAG: carboxypeptidase-like regulatory domain-containing protein [Bacteroidetes bacterium]|nr:carboxypeptidase-like regulatory domain-containing protein [Bacteroidota bacterium]MBU1720238.1 carboxypeptidase-like regulatory domain-containing protein [Bacteroidota bacterium]